MRSVIRAVVVAALTVTCLVASPAFASSHREAPAITGMPQVDATDFYMFRSYEEGREDMVVLIANYVPTEEPFGGPNYYPLDTEAFYEINIDNDGDAEADIVFRFDYAQTSPFLALDVGDGGDIESVPVPLAFIGPFGSGNVSNLNVRRSYSVRKVEGPGKAGGRFLTHVGSNATQFTMPFDNAGNKSVADYEDYADDYIFDVDIPGCGMGRVFVGQRKDSFYINLGETFDLFNLDPLGARDAQPSDLVDHSVTTFALEAPISCLTASSEVIGGWTTAQKRKVRVLKPSHQVAYNEPAREVGGVEQVSRLGMPLVNEVVIGLPDKDRFNASEPSDDSQFLTYVTHPTLPEILQLLFPVTAPNNFPRADLVAAFLTGVAGLNEFGVPAEMTRLNTAIAPTPADLQSNLGVLGGDLAGFPNGRRPGDDVVDIELRVAMGVLCHAFPGVYCDPADAPSGDLPFTDQTLQDASQFDAAFPFLTTPLPGSPLDYVP
ncbi:MAG TPA: DUF4331 domain-containing protein [Thermoanaerobaculia bacterium]|nr:DUF4331 domain-containing protein [Thermoanaerobaculia bacterium]